MSETIQRIALTASERANLAADGSATWLTISTAKVARTPKEKSAALDAAMREYNSLPFIRQGAVIDLALKYDVKVMSLHQRIFTQRKKQGTLGIRRKVA